MIAFRNLLRTKARSITTMLGIAVGMAVYVAVCSIAANLQSEAKHVIAGYRTEITIQARGAATPMASRILPETVEVLKRRFGDDVSPVVIGSLREDWNSYAMVIGTTAGVASTLAWAEGKPMSGRREVAVGSLLAQRLGLSAGSKVTLAGKEFGVAGVYSMGSRFLDGAVLADLPVAQRLLGRDQSVNLLLLRVRDKGKIPALLHEVESRFPALKPLPATRFLGTVRLLQTVDTFARALTVIAFLGASIIVCNTLLMAVSERTREIGILMAVGWHPARVLAMLFTEGLLLCLSGALLGEVLGLLLLRALSGSRAVGFGWLPTVIPVDIAVSSLALAVLLAFSAVIWPAAVVLRIRPAEALRDE